ncbi:S8 family peptidase [Ornithinibacillus scapharcae]|uniref:S8 family peptidase n=1 Tax=Ornithinibacillus scapharcae TaxID=1147159 RepID=UPI000225BB51|nr:S8 family serine peptidase [Ornithinibacillus scapharcae]
MKTATKRISSIILAILFIALSTSVVFAEENQATNERWIIGFEGDVDISIFDGISHEIFHIYDSIQAVSVSVPSINIEEIQNHPNVKWMEKDQEVSITGQVEDWGYTTTVRPETKNLKLAGEGVKIAVIDTGVSTVHPDLKLAGGVSFVEGVSTYEDDNGHGTHVAGIIGAENNDIGMLGVAPNAEIYAVKSLDKNGDGTLRDVIAGVDWAIENKMDIINLSLVSTQPTPALEQAIKKATNLGIIVVASTGNDETGQGQKTDDVLYPARYPEVIAVGSINKELVKSTFAYVGPSISFASPGEDILSTYMPVNGRNDVYAKMSGTSMAAPFVTGVIALYKELFPELGTAEIKNILYNNTTDLGVSGKDATYGYGLLLSPEVPFWDIRSNAWYSNSVAYLISNDYVTGFSDGTFRPNANISRGEVVTLVGRALGLDGTKRETVFPDVNEGHYASGYVAEANSREIVTGFPDETFKPSATITRGEVAVIIKRAFSTIDSNESLFKDVPVSKYYAKAINSLAKENIIKGYTDQTFKPNQPISRAEFSIILAKALDETLR